MNWDELYCYLITATGWTWEYIDENMTIRRLEAMLDFWDQRPPAAFSSNEVRMILRSYFGIKDGPRRRKTEGQEEEEFVKRFSELTRLMGGNV